MKTKRSYTINCKQPLNQKQITSIQSLLGVDTISYQYPKFTIYYDLQFINRELIIRHLRQENIEYKNSIFRRLWNAIEFFFEKSIIKNHRLLPYYN